MDAGRLLHLLVDLGNHVPQLAQLLRGHFLGSFQLVQDLGILGLGLLHLPAELIDAVQGLMQILQALQVNVQGNPSSAHSMQIFASGM